MESPITKEGKVRIEQELENLVRVEREELKIKIAEARALGDLRENAEYQTAKEKQSLVEGRILQLQGILSKAQIIDVSKIKSEKIVFGATVTIFDLEKESRHTYQIVSDHEADIRQLKISYTSPLGRALIGKSEGDTVVVKAPKGDLEYEIESLQYL